MNCCEGSNCRGGENSSHRLQNYNSNFYLQKNFCEQKQGRGQYFRPRKITDEERLRSKIRAPPTDSFYNPRYNTTMESLKLSQHGIKLDYFHHSVNDDSTRQWSENAPRRTMNAYNLNFKRSDLWDMTSQTYFNITNLLARGKFVSETVSVERLPFLPMTSMRLNDEVNFSQKCLRNWWAALWQNVGDIEGAVLAKTLLALSKMNQRTNGFVLEVISWDSIQSLACESLYNASNKFSSK